MNNPWFALGLDNCLFVEKNGWLEYIKLDPKGMITIRKLLGYQINPMSGVQDPLLVSAITDEKNGILTIDTENRQLWIKERDILLEGNTKIDLFLEHCLEKLKEDIIKTKNVHIWKDEKGIHTIDGKLHDSMQEAVIHGLELHGRELTNEEKYFLADTVPEMKPRENLIVLEGEATEKPAKPEKLPNEADGKDLACDKRGTYTNCLAMPTPAERLKPCIEVMESGKCPRGYQIEMKKDGAKQAKKTKKKCGGCGGPGYILITAIRDDTSLPEVQKCDDCQKYPTDMAAIMAAIQSGMNRVLGHLQIKLPECKDRKQFIESKTSPTVCTTDPANCMVCVAETIQDIQKEKLKEAIAKPKPHEKEKECKTVNDCTEIYVGNCHGCPIIEDFKKQILTPEERAKLQVIDERSNEKSTKKVTIRLEQDGKVFKRFKIKKDYNMDDLYAAIRQWAPAAPKPGMFDVHTPCGTSHVGSREDWPPTTEEPEETKSPKTKNDIVFLPKGAKLVDMKAIGPFWSCNCKADFVKPRAMLRCKVCGAIQYETRSAPEKDLNEFQRIIAKGATKINFEEWNPDDLEDFIVEIAKGMKQPFDLTELVVELSKYGMEPDAAREEATKQWREGGTLYGTDSYRLKVTVVDQENYTASNDKPESEPEN